MLINGEWCQASDGGQFDINPADGKPWALIPDATADDVDRAVRAAALAGEEGPWSRMTPTDAASASKNLRSCWLMLPKSWARSKPAIPARCSKKHAGRPNILPNFSNSTAVRQIKLPAIPCPSTSPICLFSPRREPLGVIAAVVPWNSQLFLSAVEIGPALPPAIPSCLRHLNTGRLRCLLLANSSPGLAFLTA